MRRRRRHRNVSSSLEGVIAPREEKERTQWSCPSTWWWYVHEEGCPGDDKERRAVDRDRRRRVGDEKRRRRRRRHWKMEEEELAKGSCVCWKIENETRSCLEKISRESKQAEKRTKQEVTKGKER